MHKDLDVSISTGRFRKIREWNRRRNYYLKRVRLSIKIYIAKLIWDKRRKSMFDVKSVKTILLLRNEGTIGDVVVSTPLVKCLYESGFTVDILLTKSSSAVMKHNAYIRNIYEAGDSNNEVFLKRFAHTVDKSTIKMLNENDYDLVVDLCLFDIPVHRMMLFSDINARFVLGFNKWSCINHYSKSISFENGKEHVTKATALVAHAVGINLKNRRDYDLHIPDDITFEVREYLSGWKDKIKIVINAFTGSPERNLSKEQVARLVDMLNKKSKNIKLIILDHRRELDVSLPDSAVINPFDSLHHVMALIREVDMIISPDTSIVHISAAWNKALICVYKNVTDNNDLWGPGYENARQIIVNSRKIADVDNVPELILHEIGQRDLFGGQEITPQQFVAR
ncbi:glycosyltransferase family 9 protein [Serratia marcescens]|uniref:glycosyltransferase family 9 protein n=2 Tax=Serratia TaxID=613 RepID=UPI000C13914B|nr:glycosyltransferase family 9 protein [Serratia marcescens]PHY71727.1 glycosyl transferase [Serratia marcescens]PIC07364.1 glycosyl transferase [Serratia marcescens]CAI2049323.1 lipopolysaccharide core biosynthesis protein [Serratia marcescens]HAT2876524.1 glycosyltransferase family 9 protein [Serratia marcescens]HAT2888254.1 glycosyltransferase family 9 protein [Serratia marcescens]